MKSQLLRTDEATLPAADVIDNEVISLQQKFENIFLAYQSIILDKLNSVYFFKNWKNNFMETLTLEKAEMKGMPIFDPWKVSTIDSFESLFAQREFFNQEIIRTKREIGLQDLPEKILGIFKCLAITIASKCTRMASFHEYGYQASKIFVSIMAIQKSPESYEYFEQTLSLIFHSINNITEKDYYFAMLNVYGDFKNFFTKRKKQGKVEGVKTVEYIMERFNEQVFLPFSISYMYGVQPDIVSKSEIEDIYSCLSLGQSQIIASNLTEEEFYQKQTDFIRTVQETYIKQKHPYVLGIEDSGKTAAEYFSQELEDQVKWHYNQVPYFPNWLNHKPETDLCQRLLMDKQFHRESALSSKRQATFSQHMLPEHFKDICKKLASVRTHFSEDGDHPAKLYYRINKTHLSVFITQLLQLNLDCYTHDKRLSINARVKMDTILKTGLTRECVKNGYLKARAKEMAIFDP